MRVMLLDVEDFTLEQTLAVVERKEQITTDATRTEA